MCLESTGYKESFLLGGRFGDYLLIVGRANCNKAGGTRAFSQGRFEPFGNLAVY